MSYDEATLLQMFLWGLDKDLAEKVALAYPKSLQLAISIAEDLELAIRFAHRLVVKGGAVASSSGAGTQTNTGGQQQMQWHGGRRGAGRWGRGGGHQGQWRGEPSAGRGGRMSSASNTAQTGTGVPHVFTLVTRGISHEIAPGSPMQLSSGTEAQASNTEDAQVVDRALLGSTS